jgi:hypothetical protein
MTAYRCTNCGQVLAPGENPCSKCADPRRTLVISTDPLRAGHASHHDANSGAYVIDIAHDCPGNVAGDEAPAASSSSSMNSISSIS